MSRTLLRLTFSNWDLNNPIVKPELFLIIGLHVEGGVLSGFYPGGNIGHRWNAHSSIRGLYLGGWRLKREMRRWEILQSRRA